MEVNDLSLHQRRADTYRLLSACFCPPQRTLFLAENLCGNLTTLLAAICPSAAAAAEGMATALQTIDNESLLTAHTALFVGPFALQAPPYGSVYLEKSGLLMGESTVQALRFYEKAGLALDMPDAPDHIAIELEFVGHLASLTAHALQNGDRMGAYNSLALQTDFVHRLLAPWVPSLAVAIRENATCFFYPALADCLAHFLTSDQGLLNRYAQTETA
ncbi:TorD/DmsD family molecular chaperone [Thiovibrio sp. JS02]